MAWCRSPSLSGQKRYVPFLSLRKRRTADHRQVTETLVSAKFTSNEPGVTRTRDPRIKSPLLYQLSYGLETACFIGVSAFSRLVYRFSQYTLLDSILLAR